jgi:hypothetical protein
MRLKEYSIESAIYNWPNSWSRIKTGTFGTNSLAKQNQILNA